MTAYRLARAVATKIGFAGAMLVLSLCGTSPAWAYIGDSFLLIPGQPGTWRGEAHKGWIRAEASDWVGRLQGPMSGPGNFLAGDKLWFGGPSAPRPGISGKIVLSLAKTNPDLRMLMALCASRAELPEMRYAESSILARPVLENGPRPAQIPAWWHFRFKRVKVTECPVLDGAEQQAVTIAFQDIEWLNRDPTAPHGTRIVIPEADIFRVLPAKPKPGKTVKSWVMTWISPLTDPGDAACPIMNARPTEEEVYRYLSPEDAARLRARTAGRGIAHGEESERRGPNRLNVTLFPGIVPDPGQIEPQTEVADGLDLDGNDGTGKPPRGIRKHGNFTAPDGRKGIDNQLMRIWGCVTMMRGRRGYNNQTPNARRADGNITTLIEVSDVDDPQNDNEVWVALIHSQDKPIRDIAGKRFIPGYTFRPTYDPNFAYFNLRVRGHIRNGVIETDPMPSWNYNPGQGPDTFIYNAKMRFVPQADGSLKGIIGGYQDYRSRIFGGESFFNFQAPAVWYAMRRNADGLYDPATGEYNGLSMAYEIDGISAFLTPLPADELAALRSEAAKGPNTK